MQGAYLPGVPGRGDGLVAGGFGAAFNYDRVSAAFCPLPVTLLDDSGPPMSDTYLAPCLQKQWRGLWNLPGVLPAACTACAKCRCDSSAFQPYMAAGTSILDSA